MITKQRLDIDSTLIYFSVVDGFIQLLATVPGSLLVENACLSPVHMQYQEKAIHITRVLSPAWKHRTDNGHALLTNLLVLQPFQHIC
jgi:hypothetical protein